MKLSDKLVANRDDALKRKQDYIEKKQAITKEIEELEKTKHEEVKAILRSFICFISTMILGFVFPPLFFISIVFLFVLFISIKNYRVKKLNMQKTISSLERDKKLNENMAISRDEQIEFCNSQLNKIHSGELDDTIFTYIAGVTFRKENKEKFLEAIKKDRKLNPNFNLRKSEMIENEKIWKYYPQKESVDLRFEPNNQHDPNAISVWYKNHGNELKLGYVPKNVSHLLTSTNFHNAKAVVVGGPYKVRKLTDFSSINGKEQTKIYHSNSNEVLKLEIHLKLKKAPFVAGCYHKRYSY